MNIRSLTIGAALPEDEAGRASLISRLGEFARSGKAALEGAGFNVQYVRLSAQPLERWLDASEGAPRAIASLGGQCAANGIDFCSLGTIQAQTRGSGPALSLLMAQLPEMLVQAENVFGSIQVGDRQSGGINLGAVRASAAVIKALAEQTEEGFGNLRFAAAANCAPHI